MRFSILSAFYGAFYLWGCSTAPVQPAKSDDSLKLTVVEQMKPGKTTKQEIRKLFGSPSRENDLERFETVDETGIIWGYDEGGFYNRLSLYFRKSSNEVMSFISTVREGEPEKDLRHALARFKGAGWISESERQVNPHVTPKICYFINKQGVSIEFNRARNEVTTIAWSDPARVPAHDGKNKSKQEVSCIGGHCINYDPSRLTWKQPPCPIPQ